MVDLVPVLIGLLIVAVVVAIGVYVFGRPNLPEPAIWIFWLVILIAIVLFLLRVLRLI